MPFNKNDNVWNVHSLLFFEDEIVAARFAKSKVLN